MPDAGDAMVHWGGDIWRGRMQHELAGRATPIAQGTMMAVVTTGTGGYDRLEYRQVPIPVPGPGEVLLSVLAAGVNNTDINTRLGWYAGFVKGGTDATAVDADRQAGGWNGTTPFPLIKGADCCGRVVAVGPGGDSGRIGERVFVRSCMRRSGFDLMDTVWLGTDFDGAFAQYVGVPASEVFTVDCDICASLSVSLAPGPARRHRRRALPRNRPDGSLPSYLHRNPQIGPYV